MNRVPIDIKEQLLELQKRAKDKKYWEHNFLTEKDIIRSVSSWLPETNSLLLPEVLKNDLRIMPLYEAVANWCDPDSGLGNQFPLQILEVVNKILPPEEQVKDGDTPNP